MTCSENPLQGRIQCCSGLCFPMRRTEKPWLSLAAVLRPSLLIIRIFDKWLQKLRKIHLNKNLARYLRKWCLVARFCWLLWFSHRGGDSHQWQRWRGRAAENWLVEIGWNWEECLCIGTRILHPHSLKSRKNWNPILLQYNSPEISALGGTRPRRCGANWVMEFHWVL